MYLLAPMPYHIIYGPKDRKIIEQTTGSPAPYLSPEDYSNSVVAWPSVEYLFSGWGMVPVGAEFLQRFPSLRAIFYGAGSVKHIVTEAMWERGIVLTSAVSINAIPVAEFTLSQILYAMKRGWQHVFALRRNRRFERQPASGAYRSVVGLISLGEIGRRVAQRLQGFDMVVLAYDPFVSQEDAESLGVRLVSLQEIFERADVVSCHAPLLTGTERMIRGEHFQSMKANATFINTARGEIIDEEEMIAALHRRPDLFAILDVTAPEPPLENSPLYQLDNVVLTPHIAGSNDSESRRMGDFMIDEFNRFQRGEPLQGQVTRAMLDRMA